MHLLALPQGLSGQRAAQWWIAAQSFDQGQPDCARPIGHEYDLGWIGLALDPLQYLGWRRAKHPRWRGLRWRLCGGWAGGGHRGGVDRVGVRSGRGAEKGRTLRFRTTVVSS